MARKEKTIVIGDYTFFVSGHRKVVAFQGAGDQEELKTIAEKYEQHMEGQKGFKKGSLRGEWRRCKNPRCPYVFHASAYQIRAGGGKFHSVPCRYQRFKSPVVKEKTGEKKPLKWTIDKLAKAIKEVDERHGRVNTGLLRREVPGSRDGLRKRVKKGEFKSMTDAIEKIKFLNWFREATDLEEGDKAAGWLTDTAKASVLRNPEATERLEFLNMLVEWEAERVRKAIKNIYKPFHSGARNIVKEFLQTEEGEKLRSLIDQKPSLIQGKIGAAR